MYIFKLNCFIFFEYMVIFFPNACLHFLNDNKHFIKPNEHSSAWFNIFKYVATFFKNMPSIFC